MPSLLCARGGERAKLQTIAGETVVRDRLAGIVQRSLVGPTREHIEELGVVLGVQPHAELVALLLDVVAGKNPAAQVPIVRLAVDDHFAGGQNAELDVLGGSRVQAARREQAEQQDGDTQAGANHFCFHRGCLPELGAVQVLPRADKRVKGLLEVAGDCQLSPNRAKAKTMKIFTGMDEQGNFGTSVPFRQTYARYRQAKTATDAQ